MIPVETLTTFFIASLLLAIAPGPDNIFVLTQSALHGKVSGLFVTLGLCTGLLFHTAAVALGVAAIFKASALAFTLLKTAGAGYLAYLAWQAFRAPATEAPLETAARINSGKLYLRGIVMNVTNPKVSIFFLAFLPQFADPGRGPLTVQIILLGGVFILATILVFGTVALMAGVIGEWLNRSKKAQLVMNRIAGMVFLGLALKIATIKQ